MTTLSLLPPVQMDALREVANIASGHAASALAQLVGRRTMITVPRLSVSAVEEIPARLGYGERRTVIIAMHLLGDVTGALVFLMPEEKAQALAALLLGPHAPADGGFTELAQSSLMETANILGGAYTGVLGTMMKRVVMLSVPVFGIEPPDGVLGRYRFSGTDAQVGLCIDTRLEFDGLAGAFGGHIILLPQPAALDTLIDSLKPQMS